MEDSSSRSYTGTADRMEIPNGGSRGPPPLSNELRSYSTSHTSSFSQKEMKLRKAKSFSSSQGRGWFNDPELQRKKRVAGYRVYSVESKVKGSFRKGFRWIKNRYIRVVYGWW